MNRRIIFFSLFLLTATASFSQDSTRGLIVKQNSTDSIQRNFALVVGISSYPNIKQLLYADDDAYLFSGWLVNENICEKKNVSLLIDSVATKANFFKELRKILDKSGANDRIFIYFAGHGDVENDIESGFLLTYNCEPSNYPASDAIDISMLEKFVGAFTKKNTKVVLITDACRSGNLAGGMVGASSTISALNKGFQNVIKILSCQPNQLSQERNYPGGGHGVFTYHLVDGLSGLADKDNDHTISLRELDRYLDDVGDETAQQQVPKIEGDPQSKIASFSEDLKLALIASKGKNTGVAVNNKRGSGDSSWTSNSFYQAFDQHIRKLRLLEPEKNNAFNTIAEAQTAGQPAALLEEMQLELAAVLEDQSQQFLNAYLRGEFKTIPSLKIISNARDYLVAVEKLIGEKDLRYNEIHVKKLFLEAYFIYQQIVKEADNGKRQPGNQQATEALGFLESANSLLPNQAWIQNALGLLYKLLNRPAEAEIAYNKAAELAPRWAYPWYNLGLIFISRSAYPEAEKAFKKAIELQPDYSTAWGSLGVVFVDMKKYAEAEEAYKKSIQLDSSNARPWNLLGKNYANQGKYSEAAACYKKAVQFNANFKAAWNNLTDLYIGFEKYGEAETFFKQAVQLDPTNPIIWNNYGQLFLVLNKEPEAEAAFKKAIQFDPNQPDSWGNLGDLYTDQKKYAAAETAYSKSIQVDSSYFSAWMGYGELYLILKEYSKAENALKKALEIRRDNGIAYYDLACVYSNLKKPQPALDFLELAFKNKYDDFDNLEKDPDMDNIRNTEGFKAMLKKYKK